MRTFLLSVVFLIVSCHATHSPDSPHVIIQTQAGEIEVELYPRQAPRTVAAFLAYVDAGLYKKGNFYRVLNEENQPTGTDPSELIQGGIWRTNHAKAVSLPGVPHETTQQTHILHKDGVISLARQAPGTATTEFFICVGDQPGFDFGGKNNPDGQGYAAFGKVVKGMDVVRAIYGMEEQDQSFTPPVRIINIVRD
ncbi:MAG TPA: peptidylprolyl isomerase [Puia sp.]|jgi:peptidyl-prolyl cis-trans isomerase A (cyclophilin A)|nr:peptidylprolyl isomerase [Puia sp.]